MTMPLMQYPHCAACSSMKAAWTGCGRSGEPSPSRVVMGCRAAVLTVVTQEGTARPPTITVQAPHWPRPQPNFAACSPRSLRRIKRRGVSGSASILRRRPLTLSENLAIRILIPPNSGSGLELQHFVPISVSPRSSRLTLDVTKCRISRPDPGVGEAAVALAERAGTLARRAVAPAAGQPRRREARALGHEAQHDGPARATLDQDVLAEPAPEPPGATRSWPHALVVEEERAIALRHFHGGARDIAGPREHVLAVLGGRRAHAAIEEEHGGVRAAVFTHPGLRDGPERRAGCRHHPLRDDLVERAQHEHRHVVTGLG